MARMDLSRLLRPRSVAVMGGAWARNVVEQLLKAGFEGDIWPVHPRAPDIHGVLAYPSLQALPHAPDAAWIGVNRDATIESVAALSAMGAGGAVCFASGFRETEDGAMRESALLRAAGAMPIVGPNCYGVINYLDGAALWPDQHGGARVERGVAILTQSSNLAINLTMQRRGLPLAYVMTAGNQAQQGLADMAMGLLEDSRVTAIGLHVEGVGDPAAFEALARAARARRVPVIAIKAGRSEAARAATVSHTASLAGSDAGSRAFFKRIGAPLLTSVPSFMEALKLLHVHGPLEGRELLSMSCSGGEASLMADSAEGRALRYRPYTAPQKQAVAETLNSFVTVANPLDYHTFIWNDETAMTNTFAAAMAPGFDLSMLVLDFPRPDRCSNADWDITVRALSAAARRAEASPAIVSFLQENIPEERAEALMALGIVPLAGAAETLDAAEAAAEIGEAWAGPEPVPILGPTPSFESPRDARPQDEVAQARSAVSRDGTLNEAEAKARLAEYGLRIPEGRKARTPAEAAMAAEALGYPVALKALGVAHKTEAGAVRIGLKDAAAVSEAAAAMQGLGTGLLVERMITGGLVELILGVTQDPAYGPMLTIGAGGVLTELLSDSATLLLPASDEDIRTALAGLKVSKLVAGWRGAPAADNEAAVLAAQAVARFAMDHAGAVEEIDVNPLIVCAQGAVAADALIRMRRLQPGGLA